MPCPVGTARGLRPRSQSNRIVEALKARNNRPHCNRAAPRRPIRSCCDALGVVESAGNVRSASGVTEIEIRETISPQRATRKTRMFEQEGRSWRNCSSELPNVDEIQEASTADENTNELCEQQIGTSWFLGPVGFAGSPDWTGDDLARSCKGDRSRNSCFSDSDSREVLVRRSRGRQDCSELGQLVTAGARC